MLDAIRRNTTLVAGLVVSGLVCSQAAGFMTSPRGASGPTILQAESWPAALMAVIVCLMLATAVAIVVARVLNTAVGLFVLGAGVFVLAERLTTVEEIARGDGSFTLIATEMALWAGLLLVAVIAVFRAGGPLRDVHPEEDGYAPSAFASREALVMALAGILVLPAVWLVAQSTMKGQVVGAVFVGGMLAGIAGRMLSPHVQPILLFVSPAVFGVVGYVVASSMLSVTPNEAFTAGTLPALLKPMPVDYAAGSLMGVAVGLGIARSFLHHSPETE